MKKRVNISLEDYVLKVIDNMASERGINRSAMIEQLIYDCQILVDLVDSGVDMTLYLKTVYKK